MRENEINEISLDLLDAMKNSEKALKYSNKSYKLETVKILTPVNPSKIICVGLNYKDHAQELNMQLPEEPIIFLKAPSSIISTQKQIICPPQSNEINFEVELATVIAQKAKNISSRLASDYIGGYTIVNDVTARDLQRKDDQWTRAKNFDTFCPLGPMIETEMNPQDQHIFLSLNKEIRQDSNTRNMIFGIEELLEFISHIMTLYPGDIIATGTPPGVGSMQPGDLVQAGVEDIGLLENQVNSF